MEINIYVANLGKYNEGELVGDWISLPATQDELNELFVKIKLGYFDEDGEYQHGFTEFDPQYGHDFFYEEFAIHDYEAPFKINEYDSIDKLNEYAEALVNADIDEDVFEAICDCTSTMEEALEVISNEDYRIWDECNDMSDVAYYYYEETGLMTEIPSAIQNYIDWDAVGRDMEIEGNYARAGHKVYVEVFR
ncbi:antirestriction protein ArdA [Paenibacillus hexagrammi]|uniref:Antirestriction protein ArdA n=1 Tax=Paenibacillus hexagrammi TaxID=2908839 RepID=A0ABY3ST03_9BACL|nr:antirestriction protein ArdA [Paenibacillus sp. YPD9-1]UJF36553.1 antirestriction protein ArdA [Paenibacillus sp. YPD9-1]